MVGFQPLLNVTQESSLKSPPPRFCFHCAQDWTQACIPARFCKVSVCKSLVSSTTHL